MTNYYRDYRIHNELLALRKQVEDFKSDKVYVKIKEEYERKLTEKLRQIDQAVNRIEKLEKERQLLLSSNRKLKTDLFLSQSNVSRLQTLVNDKRNRIEDLEKALADKDVQIKKMKALLNSDPYNSGLPSSRTPLNKEKPRPNSRTKSQKKIGGQKGHKKHTLRPFNENEITDHIIHEYEGVCPGCFGTLLNTGGKASTRTNTRSKRSCIRSDIPLKCMNVPAAEKECIRRSLFPLKRTTSTERMLMPWRCH